MSANNGWTKAKESKLLEWQRQSRLHSLGHGRAQELFSKRNSIILIPSIVLGALGTFLDGVALVWSDNSEPFIIGSLLITAIATILGGVLQATKPTEAASEHEDMARGYNKIVLQIDSMLAKDHVERDNGKLFLTRIEEELIALKTGGVKIPSDIWYAVRNDFLEGDCEFQKLKDAKGLGGHPFEHTIKIKPQVQGDPGIKDLPLPAGTTICTSASCVDGPTPASAPAPAPAPAHVLGPSVTIRSVSDLASIPEHTLEHTSLSEPALRTFHSSSVSPPNNFVMIIPDADPDPDADADSDADGPGHDVSHTPLPSFELKIDNDPRTKKLEKFLYDYQTSRFG